MTTCPHCGSPACMPLWRKLCMGPLSRVRCRVCGCRVAVDLPRACLAMLPTVLLLVLAQLHLLVDPLLLIGLSALGLCIAFFAYAFWVPLVCSEISNAYSVEVGRARVAAKAQQRRTR